MHNIDRTLQEFESPGQELEGSYQQDSFEQSGFGYETQQEFGNEFEFSNEFEFGHETQQEQQELEMALELLEVNNEQELNQFLGGLLSKGLGLAKQAATSFVKSPTGQAMGRHLVNFGKQTLPKLATQYGGKAGSFVGQRAGQAIGGRIGGAAGSRLGSSLGQRGGAWLGQQAGGLVGQQAGNFVADQAKRIFNLELETLSPENQELEMARAYYRYANNLARRTYQTYRRNPRQTPRAISRQVIPPVARRFAPGLLINQTNFGHDTGNEPMHDPQSPNGDGERGTWVRQNGVIILYGA